MILATSLFEPFAEALGIPQWALDGGIVTILSLVALYMARTLLVQETQEGHQTEISNQILVLFSQALAGFGKLQVAIENNTIAIKDVVKDVAEVLANDVGKQVVPLRDDIAAVRQDLLTNKKTRVVLKDSAGNTLAEIAVTPQVGKDGEPYLEVVYDLKTATAVGTED